MGNDNQGPLGGLGAALLFKNPVVLLLIGGFFLVFGLMAAFVMAISTLGGGGGFETDNNKDMCVFDYDDKDVYPKVQSIYGLSKKDADKIFDAVFDAKADPSAVLAILSVDGNKLDVLNSVITAENLYRDYTSNSIFDIYSIAYELAPEIAFTSVDAEGNTTTSYSKDTEYINTVVERYNELGQMMICNGDEEAIAGNGEIIIIGDGLFSKPLEKNLNITSNYGYRIHPISGASHLHRGTDFSCSLGDNILSVLPGVIHTTAFHKTWGNYVLINHNNGIYTLSAHMSAINVSSGQSVVAGQVVGKCGSTGDSTGPHLHFEVQLNAPYGTLANPMQYFSF